jgi:hypothetical protein
LPIFRQKCSETLVRWCMMLPHRRTEDAAGATRGPGGGADGGRRSDVGEHRRLPKGKGAMSFEGGEMVLGKKRLGATPAARAAGRPTLRSGFFLRPRTRGTTSGAVFELRGGGTFDIRCMIYMHHAAVRGPGTPRARRAVRSFHKWALPEGTVRTRGPGVAREQKGSDEFQGGEMSRRRTPKGGGNG